MKNAKNYILSLLAALIIGVLVGFRLGQSVVPASAAVGQTAVVSGQTAAGHQLDDRPDVFEENTLSPAAPEPADSPESHASAEPLPSGSDEEKLSEQGKYNSKNEVALYIKTYGRLPSNYITKKAAWNAGWSGGSLEHYFPGCSIGGDVFQNREGSLPWASGRTYYECDIDTAGKSSRGSKRIVYSNDGLIYYTDDHYRSFTLLYGKGE